MSTLGPAFTNDDDSTALPCIRTLRWLYHVTELSLLNSHIQSEGFWSVIQEKKRDQGVKSVESPDPVSDIKMGVLSVTTETLEEKDVEDVTVTTSDSLQEQRTSSEETAEETNGLGEASKPNAVEEAGVTDMESAHKTPFNAPGKAFQYPYSITDVLTAVQSFVDDFKSQQLKSEHLPQVEVSPVFSSPTEMLKEIVDKLRSEGSCSQNELVLLNL